jgi:hypothetical protein
LFKSLHTPCFGLPSDEILPQKKPRCHIYCDKDPIRLMMIGMANCERVYLWTPFSCNHWPLVPHGTKHGSWTQ